MIINGMKMDRMKRAAAAAVAALVAAASVTGCASSTDYSLTANGKKVNAGVYINFILSEMSNQMYQMYYSGEITKMEDCFEKQVDGKDFTAYVKDKALDNTKEFAAIAAKFDELGLSLSEDDAKTIETSVSNAWSSQKDYYELEGISRESLKMCSELSYKKNAIFDHYYSENGVEAVSKDQIQQYVNDNYVRYKLLTIPKSSETDEEAKNKENEELKKLWEQYASEAESLDFAGFDKIFDEYDAYKEQKKAEKEAAEKATAETETVPADELKPEDLDGSEQVIDVDVPPAEAAADEKAETAEVTKAPADEDKPAETTTPAESKAPETSEETTAAAETSAPEESAPDAEGTKAGEAETPELISPAPADSSSEGESAPEAEEEKDPYANETVTNYTEAVDTTGEYYTETYGKLLEEIKKTEYGKVGKHENNDCYYLFIPADVSERTDYTEDHHDTLLHKMKDAEFDGLVKGWIDAASIVVNDKAVKRYTVKEAYDRQLEYTSKNGVR